MVLWKRSASEGKPRGPKTVNIFFGFFFVINFCLGTGFLGIPYSFFYAGFPAAIITLLVIAFVSWNTATWEIEVMARAQAVESFKRFERRQSTSTAFRSGSTSTSESELDETDMSSSLISDSASMEVSRDDHPKFRILLTRKFEPTEMCEVFFNRWVKQLYLVVMIIYSFLAGWSYSTVAGSAWATNIPFKGSQLKQCASSAFQHNLFPTDDSCLNSYRLCLLFFAVIVITLSMMDLKEQAIVQMILGLLRFATIVAIIVYSVVQLVKGDNPCEGNYRDHGSGDNETVFGSGSGSGSENWSVIAEGSSFSLTNDLVFKFDPRGWLVAIPVLTYAYIIHQGIPSLTHPIKQKEYLRWFMVCLFAVTTCSYLALGITVALYFRGSVQETATLNWVSLSGSDHSPQLRALSYYLVLFPSLDVCSAYPLVVHAITNNIYTVVFGRDSSKRAKHRFGRYDLLIQLILRFVVGLIPIVAALFISNLVQVLKYAGIMGFAICFFFPTALQLQSQRVCKKLFGLPFVECEEGRIQEKRPKEKAPLLSLQEKGGPRSLYLTPYSNRLLSHPVTACVLGSIGIVLFLLAISSLFVHPDSLTCVVADEG